MQITDNHIDEVSLTALGTEANCLLCSGNIPTLVERFGYARAFDREPATAIRENLASCLAELRTTNLVVPAEPSRANEMLTRRLRDALALVDVRVLDHFVVSGGESVSFAECGLF